MRLSSVSVSASLVFVLSAAFAVLIFGFRIANLGDTSWMSYDTSTMQFAFAEYRADTSHLFTFATDRVSWPLRSQIGMFDNIPIISWVCKILSPILPEKFQYFGPLFIIGSGLQGLISYKLLKEKTKKQVLDNDKYIIYYEFSLVIGSLIFSTAPILYARFYMGHVALAMQWLIILSLWIYTRSDRVGFKKTIISYSILCFFAFSLNPYMSALVFFIYIAYVLKEISDDNLKIKSSFYIFIPFIVSIISTLLFGFYDISGKGIVNRTGYGYYSSNFNSLINPRPTIIGSSFLPPLPIAFEGQNDEGYAYLGLGAIILAAFGLYSYLSNKKDNDKRIFYNPLFIVFIITFILSLSQYITFGSNISAIPLPKFIINILEIYRSSGRFIWDSVYILLFISISQIILYFNSRKSMFILVLCGLVQIADLAQPYATLHAHFAAHQGVRFNDAIFANLGRANDTLLVLPAWQCGPWDNKSPDAHVEYKDDDIVPLSFLAADNHLRTNSSYAGRVSQEQIQYHCFDFPQTFDSIPPNKRTVYIFSPRSFLTHGAHVTSTHYCDFAEDLFVCRADLGLSGLSARAQKAVRLVPLTKSFHIPV